MDTMAHQKQRPLQTNIDLSEASLQHVMQRYTHLRTDLEANDGAIEAKPETDALWFYVQQHALSLADRNLDRDEPMGDYQKYVEDYHRNGQRKVMRMFYYLLLICTRESRHANSGAGKQKLYAKYPNIVEFHKNHVQDSSATSAIQALIDNAPDVTLGEYTEFLVSAFTMPGYTAGYGGKAWAKIARPLRDFVAGKISAEILMDTAWTLEHNNGQIFNKGMLYHNGNSSVLHKILDVQRSGQIPQLIAHHYSDLNNYIPTEMRQYVDDFMRIDSGFGGRVDWHDVKDINGNAKYHAEKDAQDAAAGNASWKTKLAAIKAEAAEKAAKLKAKAAKAALLKGAIEILPGTWVAKGKRSQK
jgi:hypothetical protein